MRTRMLQRGLLLGALIAGVASAQQFPLELRTTLEGQTFFIANNSTLSLITSLGHSQTVEVIATYIGSGKINVTQLPQIFGSTDFTASLSGKLPLTLNPHDSLTITIQFQPASSAQASGIFNLPFTETVAVMGSQLPVTTANAITLSLLGSAASFVLSYTKNGNVIPLANGGSMLFDPQPINTTVTLLLNISNGGSATGQVTGITLSGSAFKLIGEPLLPTNIPAGQTLQVGIEYTPTAVASDTGQVQLTLSDGTNLMVNLQGSGISSVLVYTLIVNGNSTPITAGGTVPLPDTNVGSSSSGVIRIQNTGAASTTITSINVAGQAFLLSPVVLPKILNKNDSFTFTITFTPLTPGTQNGALFINSDSFTLTGKGLGALLQFSYAAAGSTLVIGQNGVTSVVFSPAEITTTETIPFTVKNTGTLPAVISNVVIGENNSPFSISELSAKLPVNLAPNGSVSFTLGFAPTTAGVSNGTLFVNSLSVPLQGSATAPPPLPAYTISGPSGNVAAQSQLAVGLKLASAYPIALNGVLTLTTSGSLPTDPAVQFLTGGRTVPFIIPANSTDANFASQGTQILLQTGTVAETVTLTPSFTTAGGVVLTPSNPATLQFTVPSSAPVLIAGVEASSSINGVVLNFTGYSSTRTLTSLNVQFTAANGFTLAGSQVTVDLHEVAIVWFNSAASQSFGGQFTVSVPFTFSGTPPKGVTLLQTVASFTATISNEVGASNSVGGPIQ